MIQVDLYATFRLIAGIKTIEIPHHPGMTILQAVDSILERVPALRSHWLDDTGQVYPHVHIFLNSADCATLPGALDTLLSDGDRLDFFPPVAGG